MVNWMKNARLRVIAPSMVNPLESRGNYSATSRSWYTVWAVTFGTAMRGLGEATARPGPSSLYQM